MLTPVALLDPVEVGGVTVSRATLHNADEVEKKDLRPGDTVRVERAGDVIPEVVERIKKPGRKRGKKFSMPERCPSCGSKVYREGAYYFCPAGLSCPARMVEKIKHYASRPALDIEGLGDKIAKSLVEKEMVKNPADLYGLSKSDLKKLEVFAEKSADNLYRAIQGSTKVKLDRFLYALGIRHVGKHIARVLSREFRSLDKLKKADREDLEEVEEIGPEIAESIYRFFRQKENKKVLKRLDYYRRIFETTEINNSFYQLAGRLSPREVTADFVYIRLHGPGDAYQGSYSDRDLAGWAGAFSTWAGMGKDVYCYFDNDDRGFAPKNALRLKEMIERRN